MKKPTFDQLDSFTRGYVEALFFTELPDTKRQPGPMTQWFDFAQAWHQLTRKTQDAIRADCDDFQNQDRVKAIGIDWLDRSRAGRDFWYTRNRHGAGFWDGDWGEHGRELTELCRPYGTQETHWHKSRLYLYGVN